MHPLIVRHVVLPLHERLKRTPTFAWLKHLERTQWMDPAKLRDLQFAELRRHLEFAYRHTRYYRRLFDEHEVPPHRIQSLEDFRKVPVLTRQLLRENFDDLMATGVRLRRVQRVSTGGSTGEPVTLLVDTSVGFAIALRHRAHRWFGLEPGAREIVLWGSPIEATRQDRLRNLRDWLINSKLISAFDLGAPALAEYARIITRHRPLRIYGYASAIYLLACFLEREGWRPDWRLHAVFTTAETLFDFQRKTIEAVFGCPVAVEYGARDAGNMANECPHGGLHIPAEGVVLETIAVAPDGLGEIVATNCHRPAMPLIRYRTGDLGELTDERCRCGRSLPSLKRIEGRRTDFLVAPDGRILHALALIYVLREMERVREFQIVQEDVDSIVALVVAAPGWSRDDDDNVQRAVRARIGADVDVRVETVAAIPRTQSGKFRYVVSRVADDFIHRVLSNRRPAVEGACS